MACADIPMDIQGTAEVEPLKEDQSVPRTKRYQASELMASAKGPLDDLLQRQPAVLGSLQMASGVLSFGLGVVFTVTQNMTKSLFALFRVAQLTGTLFFIAGLLSNLLFKYPRLLPVCFPLNLGCITVGVVGVILIIVDLTQWDSENYLFKIEMLALAVLALKILLSIIICVFTWIETWSKPS